MSQSVLCIVKSEVQAERIASALTTAGFRSDDISVLFADQDRALEFAHDQHTMTPDGATTGGGAGGVIGGALGWLVGIGSLAIPGAGAFIAEGPIQGGSLLISVHIDDSTQVDHVKEIFKQQEAEYISYTRETPPRLAAT